MPADVLARATDPFFTTKDVGQGTGLRLAMVHGLAEQSNGSMSIQSTPGHGTVVSLLLPVAVAHAQGATTTGLARPRAPGAAANADAPRRVRSDGEVGQ
jgi:K+-sensing histidine kinase KdpD